MSFVHVAGEDTTTICCTFSDGRMMMPPLTGEKYSKMKVRRFETIPEEDETQLEKQQFLLKRKQDAFMEGRCTSLPDLFSSDGEEVDLSDTVADLYKKSTFEMRPLSDIDIEKKINAIEKKYSYELKSRMIRIQGEIINMTKKATKRSFVVVSGALSLLIIIIVLLVTLPYAHGGAVLVSVNYETAHHDVQILQFLPRNWEVDVWVADEFGEQIPKFLHTLGINFTIHGIWHFLPNPILPCEKVCNDEAVKFQSLRGELINLHWRAITNHSLRHEYIKHAYSWNLTAAQYFEMVIFVQPAFIHATWCPRSCRYDAAADDNGANFIQEATSIPVVLQVGCKPDKPYYYNDHQVDVPFKLIESSAEPVRYKHRYAGMPQTSEEELGPHGTIEPKHHLSFLKDITNKDEFNKVMYYGGNDDIHLKMQVTGWPVRFINVLSSTIECTRECGDHGLCVPNQAGGDCVCYYGYIGAACNQPCLTAGTQPEPQVAVAGNGGICSAWTNCGRAAGVTAEMRRLFRQAGVRNARVCLDLIPYGLDGAYCCSYTNRYVLRKCGITPCSSVNADHGDALRAEMVRRSEGSSVTTYSSTCFSHYLPYFGTHNVSELGSCGRWLSCLDRPGIADLLDKTGTAAGSNYCRKINEGTSCCVRGQLAHCTLPACQENLEIDNIDYINETTFENLTYSTVDISGHEYFQTDVMVHGHFIVGANAIIPDNIVNTVFYMNNTRPGYYYTLELGAPTHKTLRSANH